MSAGWQEPCDKGHEVCEGRILHIRARCKTGCPQFQDGSWMARDFCKLVNPHPPLPGKRSSEYGEADVTLDYLAAHGIGG